MTTKHNVAIRTAMKNNKKLAKLDYSASAPNIENEVKGDFTFREVLSCSFCILFITITQT